MVYRVLVLGASYGSLLATKIAMAGHDATLVCRAPTAALINAEGTEVRMRLKRTDAPTAIRSALLPGRIDAAPPETVDLAAYDLVALAMQEPQYCTHVLRTLMIRIAEARLPCLSIMNMPPLPYLRRIPGLNADALVPAYADARVWERFEPGLVTLCSPDPQAVRPPDEKPNVLMVGLPTNFKAARFADAADTAILENLEADIAAVTMEGSDIPVKLRVHESLFVPLAKWSMLLAGNYRCITPGGPIPIREVVHGDPAQAEAIYDHVGAIARRLGAAPEDQVPFEKYARAAESLTKPSSVARAVAAGSPMIERVDRLVQLVARQLDMEHPGIDRIVATVDAALARNQVRVA